MLESRTSFVITVFVVISKIENVLLIVSPVVHRVYLYKSITMIRENNEKKINSKIGIYSMMMLTFVLFQSSTYIKALTRQWRLIDGKRETEIRSGIKVLEGSAEQQVCSQSERWVQIRNGLIFLSKTADRMADVNLFFIYFFPFKFV